MSGDPIIIHTISQLREKLQQERQQGRRIALVPTMGNLHAGHLSLVKYAQNLADIVVVSIFVNPMQFAAHEDFSIYPRTLPQDVELLAECGPVVVFAPTAQQLYPEGLEQHMQIRVPRFEGVGCAVSRPHFFTGVATVVMKLFGIVQPEIAVFGEKDFQQVLVIKQMVRDGCLPIQIIGAPIVREHDGLAMSSRNSYLSPTERQLAPTLYQTLLDCAQQLRDGARHYRVLEAQAKQSLSDLGWTVDYFVLSSQESFQPLAEGEVVNDVVIAAAAFLGKTRLIDNVSLQLA